MPKSYNIVTKVVNPPNTTGAAVAIGSSVAAGMTRYITFIAITPRSGNDTLGRKIYFCSTTSVAQASTLAKASANGKWLYRQASASFGAADPNYSIPRKIDTENPLFTIAASKFLTIRQGSTVALGNGACSIFVQYYDQ